MTAIVRMRGLLAEMRGLSAVSAVKGLTHLGAVNSDTWSAVVRYKYSIPLEIIHSGSQKTEVRWKQGGSLEGGLEKAVGKTRQFRVGEGGHLAVVVNVGKFPRLR